MDTRLFSRKRLAVQTLLSLMIVLMARTLPAQYAERGALVGSGTADVDCSGRSVKNPRVRAIHTTDPDLEGRLNKMLADFAVFCRKIDGERTGNA